MTNFTIKIVSDTVCPWCYVGKKRLDKAISLYRSAHASESPTFSISWHPFYLNPHSPSPGVDKRSYVESRFGADRVLMMQARLSAAGDALGINFKYGGRTGNTRDSHRLIQLAKTKGEDVQNRVVEELFKSYFEEEGDITSLDMLVAAGVKAGLEDGEVKGWLGGYEDKGGAQVDAEVKQAQREFISGVPHFTIQGKYHVGGAEDPEVFLEIFEKVRSEGA